MGRPEIDSVVNTYPVSAVKRTSINLDSGLVAEARAILGARGTTDTVNRALAAETFEDLTPEALAELRRTRTRE